MEGEPSERERPQRKRKVGSGITEYERRESLFDPEYLDRMRRGEPVPADIPRSGSPALNKTCDRLFAFCREVYERKGLPDPFSSSHPQDALPSVSLEEALSGGSASFELLSARLYQPNCLRYSPHEDHSELWYASQIALQLMKLEWYARKAQEGTLAFDRGEARVPVSAAETARLCAFVGWELGRLDAEYRLKFAHEKDALAGSKSRQGRTKTRVSRRRNSSARNAARFERMDGKIARGASVQHSAFDVVAEDNPRWSQPELDRAAATLAKAYRRRIQQGGLDGDGQAEVPPDIRA